MRLTKSDGRRPSHCFQNASFFLYLFAFPPFFLSFSLSPGVRGSTLNHNPWNQIRKQRHRERERKREMISKREGKKTNADLDVAFLLLRPSSTFTTKKHRRRRSTPLLAAPFYAAGSAVRFALELLPALLALFAAGGAEAKARLLGGGVSPSSSSPFSPPLPGVPAASSLRKRRSGRGVVLGLAAAAAAANGIANLLLDAATRRKVAAVAEARGYPAEALERARDRAGRRVDPTALLSARRGMSEDLEGAGIGYGSSGGGGGESGGGGRGGAAAAAAEAAEAAAEARASAEASSPRSPPSNSQAPPPPSSPLPPSSPPAYALRRPPLPPPPRNAFGDPLALLVPPPVARYLRFALPGGPRPALRLTRATQTGDFRFRIATGLRPDEGWKRVTATQTWNASASTPGYCWAASVTLAPGLWVRGWDALCGEYESFSPSSSSSKEKKPRKKILHRGKKTNVPHPPPKKKTR